MAVPAPDTAVLVPGGPPLPSLLVSDRQVRMQRIWRAVKLWVPLGVVLFLLAMCFLLPLVVTLPSPTNGDILAASLPPLSPGHLLGTDTVGVDELSQVVYGGQVSFEVAAAVTAIGIAVGGVIGVTAGYLGGWIDAVLSRVLDVLIAFPALVLALAVSQGLGPSEIHVIWALSFFGVPVFGRIARANTLVIRELPFVTAARLSGTPGWRVVARHVVPNILPGVVSFGLLGAGLTIILEGALDYLGYGIPPPEASWGSMIASGQQYMSAEPRYVLIPSIFLVVVVVALNMFGDALRERWGAQ
ncbi:MAG: ABC transporter permease [Nocardiopsaceae bacterium]|nr:ABC transporter permease [Nocardiopsaceae bacterium]